MRPPSLHKIPVAVIFPEAFLQRFLHAVEIIGWKKFSIGHGLNTIIVATNANKFFDVRIPWCDLVVPNWPVNAVSVFCRSGELKITPTLAGAPPDKRFSSHLISPDPVERLFLLVGMILVFDKKM